MLAERHEIDKRYIVRCHKADTDIPIWNPLTNMDVGANDIRADIDELRPAGYTEHEQSIIGDNQSNDKPMSLYTVPGHLIHACINNFVYVIEFEGRPFSWKELFVESASKPVPMEFFKKVEIKCFMNINC
jgi:hypothetical protein